MPAKLSPANHLVFRGSMSATSDVFSRGFTPRHSTASGGIEVQKGGQMIGGVSTTKDLAAAMRYAGSYSGFVYVVYADKGVNILNHLTSKSGADPKAIKNAVSQAELAMGTVPANQVIAGRKCAEGEKGYVFDGPIYENPGCTVDTKMKQLALGYLKAGVVAPKEYA